MATVGRGESWLARQLELSRGGAEGNLLAMEGLRGVAVALVFGVHFATLASAWVGQPVERMVLDVMHTIGHAGVDLFFVLSGFLIYGHLLRRPQPYFRYMGRRVQRIYPTFLAMFALYVAISWWLPEHSKLPQDGNRALYILANLAMLPGLFPIEPVITVAWSLSYEMFFYLVMPLAMAVTNLRKRRRGARVAGLVAVLLVALIAFGIFGGPVRLVMFVFGAILAEVLSARRGPGSIFGALAGLAGLAWMLVPAQGASEQALRYAVLGLCAGVLCHAALSGRAPALVAVLCFRPLRWLGNMSYSYYLMHGLALHAFFLVVERILAPDALPGIVTLLLVPAFLWTLCPSAMLFLAVERPLSLASPKR